MIFRSVCALCLLHILFACGGGTGVSGGALGSSSTQDPGPTEPSTLPMTGQASYSGFMALNLPRPGADRETYTGTLGLAVDFASASGQLTGAGEGFRGSNGTVLEGRIFVTDGTLERGANVATDYTFEAGVSGTLNGDGLQNSVVTGLMTGDFVGTDAGTVTGVTFGNVTTVTGVDVFDGSFAAAKN